MGQKFKIIWFQEIFTAGLQFYKVTYFMVIYFQLQRKESSFIMEVGSLAELKEHFETKIERLQRCMNLAAEGNERQFFFC